MPDQRSRNANRSLEQAQQQADQHLRRFSPTVVQQLDRETQLAIELNGLPIARIACMDSALAELAVGWVCMNRLCDTPADFDRVTLSGTRAAVMVSGSVDIARFRAMHSGANLDAPALPVPFARADDWFVYEDVLLDILQDAWHVFRQDRMAEGSIHAALASEEGIEVVAFDLTAENAAAKVLGFCLKEDVLPAPAVLIVNGLITRAIVDAASQLGVLIIATPFVPTNEALLTSRIAGVTIVGYMRNHTVGVFGDSEVIRADMSSETRT